MSKSLANAREFPDIFPRPSSRRIGHAAGKSATVLGAESLPAAGPLTPFPSTIIPKIAYGIYFAPNAKLSINAWNSVANQALTFQCWYLDPGGDLKQIPNIGSGALADMTALTSARAANIQTVTMPSSGGTIISFTARISSSTTTYRGQTLVKAELDNLGNGGAAISTTQVIAYGYVYTRKDLAYPAYDSIQDPVSGQGYQHNIRVLQTLGGSFVNLYTVPTNARMRIKQMQISFTADATAGARYLYFLAFDAAGHIFWYGSALPTVTANGVITPQLIEGYPSPVDAVIQTGQITSLASCFIAAPFILLAGYQIGLNPQNADPGDSSQLISVYVEEWIDPDS